MIPISLVLRGYGHVDASPSLAREKSSPVRLLVAHCMNALYALMGADRLTQSSKDPSTPVIHGGVLNRGIVAVFYCLLALVVVPRVFVWRP